MPQTPSLVDLLEAGLHFGHKRSRRHPKMEPFIFAVRNEINIIDLRFTREALERSLEALKNAAAAGGSILFVGTKKQAAPLVQKYATECGQPYVSNRWLGGTITNFSVISKLIKKYTTLKNEQASGEFEKYTKKEQLELSRKIQELDSLIGGIEKMTKLPSIVFISDMHHDTTAVKEARLKHIPIVGVCDTNVNPELATYPIPANDDAVKGIELVLSLASKSILEGKTLKTAADEKERAEKAEKAEKTEKAKETAPQTVSL